MGVMRIQNTTIEVIHPLTELDGAAIGNDLIAHDSFLPCPILLSDSNSYVMLKTYI